MIKKNKWKLFMSSIIILLPIIVGFILWDILPEQMATHWGANGVVDGFGNRFFAVLAPPLFMFVVHWIRIFITAADSKNKNQTGKAMGLVFWIWPFVSLFTNGIMYAAALGMNFHIEMMVLVCIGLMFVVIGNYLPKCKQNNTLGIKMKWTLENEENWNATHRFGGRVCFIGGLLLMVCIFLPESVIPYALVSFLLILAMLPMIYSYVYHCKQLKEGTAVTNTPMSRRHKRICIIVLCMVCVIFLGCEWLLFTGNIEIKYGESSFAIETAYWSDLTVDYTAIENIEYQEQNAAGVKTNGFSSFRLQTGMYQNEEYGQYTRYTYTGCDYCIVLTVSGRTLVVSGVDAESTKVIYEKLVQMWRDISKGIT